MNYSELESGLDAALKSNLSTRATPVAAEGPFDRAHSALTAARMMADRIVALRDRLLGSAPESDASNGISGAEGVFNQLEAHADRTSAMLADAGAALNAIERALP